MSLTPEELAFRKTGMGGSDASIALGVNPWRSPHHLWMDKIDHPDFVPVEQTEAMELGNEFEATIARIYTQRTGREVVKKSSLRSNEFPWMIANIDGEVIGENRGLEVKMSWTTRGWGSPGTDEIPIYHLMQVHHYMVVQKYEVMDVAAFLGAPGGFRLWIYEVPADKEIAEALVDQEADFWHKHVLARVPPPVANYTDAVARWGRLSNPGTIVVDDDSAEMAAVTKLHELNLLAKDLKIAEEEAKSTIIKRLADAGDTLVDLGGRVLCTWALDKGRKGYEVAPHAPSRRFLLKD